MVEAVTLKHSDKLHLETRGLKEYLGISDFYYFQIKNDGNFYFIGSYVDWNEYFVDEQLIYNVPYYRHPDLIQEGILPLKSIEDQDFSKVIEGGKDKFNISLCFAWLSKIAEGVEGFGILTRNPNEYQNALLINDLPALRLFAKKFKEKNRFLFEKAEEHQVNLNDLLGPIFTEKNTIISSQKRSQLSFLHKTGIIKEAPLSPREKEVLRKVLEGFSATEIGKELFLSSRTIEHHLERLKHKLQCESKRGLIQKARELDQVGFFQPISP